MPQEDLDHPVHRAGSAGQQLEEVTAHYTATVGTSP